MESPKNAKKSSIVILKNGEKFIEPEIEDLFPELYALGSQKMYSNKYHFDNLYSVLFKTANHRSTSHYFEKKIDNIRKDISYHINQMLDHQEKKSTIIDLCNQFEAVCEQFLADTHPLSLRLIAENDNLNDEQIAS